MTVVGYLSLSVVVVVGRAVIRVAPVQDACGPVAASERMPQFPYVCMYERLAQARMGARTTTVQIEEEPLPALPAALLPPRSNIGSRPLCFLDGLVPGPRSSLSPCAHPMKRRPTGASGHFHRRQMRHGICSPSIELLNAFWLGLGLGVGFG